MQSVQEITDNLIKNLRADVYITNVPWENQMGWDCNIQHSPGKHQDETPTAFNTQTIAISMWDHTLEGAVRRANETFLSALATGSAESNAKVTSDE